MNIALELETYDYKKGTNGPYLRMHGTQRNGKAVYISFFGPAATKLAKELGDLVPFGSTVADMRLFVDVKGEWRDGKDWTDGNGVIRKQRFFRGDTFEIPQGRALELERVRNDASRLIGGFDLENLSGQDLVKAFRELATFVSKTAGVTVDLSQVPDFEAAEQSLEVPHTSTTDPEGQALDRYDREDRKNGLSAAVEGAPSLNVASSAAPSPEEDSAPEVPEVAEPENEVEDDIVDVPADQEFVAAPSDEISESIADDLAAAGIDPLAIDNDVDFGDDDDGLDDSIDPEVATASEPEVVVEDKVAEVKPVAAVAQPVSRPFPGRPVSAPSIQRPAMAAPAKAAPAAEQPQAAASAPTPAARPSSPPMVRPQPRPPMPGLRR
jgi:hypothetical protein